MVLATQDTGHGGRRHRVGRATAGVLLSAAVVCGVAACSWGGDDSAQQVSSSVEPDATDEATTSPSTSPETESSQKPQGPRGGGGGSGGSPVAMATAAQQDGNDFLDVRAEFIEQMTVNCGGTLCVTVVSEPPEADNACKYRRSDPPWREGGFTIPRWSTVVLVADCSPGTGDPGDGTQTGTETGVETGTEGGSEVGTETGTGSETGPGGDNGSEEGAGSDGEGVPGGAEEDGGPGDGGAGAGTGGAP